MVRRDAYLLAGPTASGKSAAAALLARRLGAAILSADSMLVYVGMDVGTAKPSREERAEFDMGGVDLVTPAEHFSSGAWLRAAACWLADVPAERPVVIVGGTGLYFSALLRGLDRKWVQPPPEYPVLQLDRAVLHARISARLDDMLADGTWLDEVRQLLAEYPIWSDTAQVAIGYRELAGFIKDAKVVRELNIVREKILARTRQLAKRQMTWFRHQSTPLYVTAGDTADETAENVWRTWCEHGPWQVCLPEEGDSDAS